MPKFASAQARAQIDQLMQPALIRVIDNLRKQLDESAWQGRYEEELIWPEGTTETQKARYAELQKGLHGVPPEEHDRIAEQMSALPQPTPLYSLHLTKPDSEAVSTVDIWGLCFKVCATEESHQDGPEDLLVPDLSLVDEAGEIDWRRLDEKVKGFVTQIFDALPDG